MSIACGRWASRSSSCCSIQRHGRSTPGSSRRWSPPRGAWRSRLKLDRLAAISTEQLGDLVGNLAARDYDIRKGLDLLFAGF
jgi:hypothetical protein